MINSKESDSRLLQHALLALGTVALVSCAGVPRPDAELARSDSAVTQAIELGARTNAPLVLRDAETKLNQAKLAANNKENGKARILAEEAQVDAELAQVTTLALKAQRSVDEINTSIDLLRKELGLKQ
ncbi:MAG: hypothetical protein A2W18_12750 [Candidatus Muproteobacteria bacterium RBG_16_60_9]|uniref:DUF4398 domain-containing protein n=1 Tax=Candidatus Muproteobacteria bacterium RBG_16_60_9 TaxID=1817755 RepID=A0A1F6V7A5_9PROT|nr:MAG: hypothetical protein A2W18_12750 [Candidatus Muproteobacteria bacterium RBG_16_60_9]